MNLDEPILVVIESALSLCITSRCCNHRELGLHAYILSIAVVDSELKPFAAAMLSPLLSLLAASAMRPPPAMMPTCRALPPRMSSAVGATTAPL